MKTLNALRLLPLLGTVLALHTGASMAAPVSFNLTTGGNGAYRSYTATASGVSVNATALVSEAGGGFNKATVVKVNSGLGVVSGGTGALGMVDNAGGHVEALLFDFGAKHFDQLTVSFTQLEHQESVSLWWGDSLDLNNAGAPLIHTANNLGQSLFTLNQFAGARYLLVAAANNGISSSGCGQDNSCFRVDGLTGTVPEPGALALVALAGVLGVATSRRRAQPQG